MTKVKKTPLRLCLACKEMKDKKSMLRVVKISGSDEFVIDNTGKLNGRGAYICNSPDCIKVCVKNKLLNRSFKQNVNAEIYDEVKEKSIAKQ